MVILDKGLPQRSSSTIVKTTDAENLEDDYRRLNSLCYRVYRFMSLVRDHIQTGLVLNA